jgi:hypothetical protein
MSLRALEYRYESDGNRELASARQSDENFLPDTDLLKRSGGTQEKGGLRVLKYYCSFCTGKKILN